MDVEAHAAVGAHSRVETSPRSHRDARAVAHDVLVVAVGVVSVILLMLATTAVWARAVAFDSERIASIVGEALSEPAVDAAIAAYVTDHVFAAVDVDAVVNEVLPDQLQGLRQVLVAGVNSAVERAVSRLLADPEARELIAELVRRAHQRAMHVLQGDGLTGISVVDGAVTLNVLPLVSRGLAGLQDLGLVERLVVPELAADGEPAEHITQLEEATGRDLPDDFGQLVVYRGDHVGGAATSLDGAQRVVTLAKRASWVLVALTVTAFAATVVVARRRWRATLWLGLGSAVAMVVVRSAVHRVVDDAPGVASTAGARAAVAAILGAASTSLLRLAGLVGIVAAVVVIVALMRRRWHRDDLVVVGATLAVVASIVVLGLSLAALVTGAALGGLVHVVARRSPSG